MGGGEVLTARSARQDGYTPVYIASENGDVEVVSRLIAAGADVNTAAKVSGLCGGVCGRG